MKLAEAGSAQPGKTRAFIDILMRQDNHHPGDFLQAGLGALVATVIFIQKIAVSIWASLLGHG